MIPLDQKLLHVIDGTIMTVGPVSLASELFLVRFTQSTIDVYDATNFSPMRRVTVPGLEYPWGMYACPRYSCLYVCDSTTNRVHRIEQPTGPITTWSLTGQPAGVSVTANCDVLVTLCDTGKIQEFTTRGVLLREIVLDRGLDNPGHAVQLSSSGGRFVVSHAGSTQHRVCVVDTAGRIIHTYEGPPGSYTGQVYWPCTLAVDGNGYALVADYHNNKVRLLSPTLGHLGDVTISGHQLSAPSWLSIDEANGRLYICDIGGRVIVTSIGSGNG